MKEELRRIDEEARATEEAYHKEQERLQAQILAKIEAEKQRLYVCFPLFLGYLLSTL